MVGRALPQRQQHPQCLLVLARLQQHLGPRQVDRDRRTGPGVGGGAKVFLHLVHFTQAGTGLRRQQVIHQRQVAAIGGPQ